MDLENKENIDNSSNTKITGVTSLPDKTPESPVLKTVINIDSSHRPISPNHVQHDVDSILSNSSTSVSAVSNSEERNNTLQETVSEPTVAKKMKRSPTPFASTVETDKDVEEIEYVNACISSSNKK